MKITRYIAISCLLAFTVVHGMFQAVAAANESEKNIGYGRGGRMQGGFVSERSKEPIQPIPIKFDDNRAKTDLGMKLFFEPRLSKSGWISCNSCHNLATGGADNLPTSIGHKWLFGPINAPTVLNAKFNLAQFWDGRAGTLKEQAKGPIANPLEMASNHELAVNVLQSIPEYVKWFKEVYGDGMITNVTKMENDKYVFKVPLLRNIELTAPYFHDASTWSLSEAVTIMAEYQLGVTLTNDERCNIVAFLNTLTGEQPAIVFPILPPSNENTPKPNRN